MIVTRSKRGSNYIYQELPDKKRNKKQRVEQNIEIPEQKIVVEQNTVENITIEINNSVPIYRVPIYSVDIDFDEAHREWMKNKVKLQNGCYAYKKETKHTRKRQRQ